MRFLGALLACASCATSPSIVSLQPAQTEPTVGLMLLEAPDPVGNAPLKIAVWYPPATEQVGVTTLGPYRTEAAIGAPVAAGAQPLIIISHGHAGSRCSHHDLAEHLARAGFIVAALDHAGDSWSDQSGVGSDRV